MKKSTKKILSVSSIALAAVSVASVTSYLTTKYWVKIALDREEPKLMKNLKKTISGSTRNNEFWAEIDRCSKALAEKEHENVSIVSRDGVQLVGHWFKQDGAERVVIAMHGWRSSWTKDFGMISDFWFNNGCSVLFVEQRGQNNSGGDYMGFGLVERYDCLDWINWVIEQCGNDIPIYLGGVSMGATTVMMATGLELPQNVHGVVADCGFTSPHAIWKHVANNNLRMPYFMTGIVADAMCKRKINMGTNEYSTLDAMKNCSIPIMFVHGTDDRFVPIRMTYENYKTCAAPKKIMVVPGAGHGMSYYMAKDEYEAATIEFWKKFD